MIAWNEIKTDYLLGVTPKELAEKYNIKIEKIYKKIENAKWANELRQIKGNIGNDIQNKIRNLTDLALEKLRDVINDPEADDRDKVSACRAILDVSGLKSLKQEVSGIDGVSVIVNRQAVQIESNN